MGAIPSQARKRASGGKHRRGHAGEAIEVQRKRFGYFPEVFVSRGHQYQVYAVERCWTISKAGRAGPIARHCFRVRCREGVFDLYQDAVHNTWHLQQQVAERA